jgi:hypothetical protein
MDVPHDDHHHNGHHHDDGPNMIPMYSTMLFYCRECRLFYSPRGTGWRNPPYPPANWELRCDECEGALTPYLCQSTEKAHLLPLTFNRFR